MLALLLFACADRPQVAESWQIDRMRILAVAPEPPEAHPGDTVQFRALIVSPNQPVDCSAWLGCSADSGFGCGFSGDIGDTAAPDTGSADPSTAFLGIDPYFPPSWTLRYALKFCNCVAVNIVNSVVLVYRNDSRY